MDYTYAIQPEFVLFLVRVGLGIIMFHYGLPKVLDIMDNAEWFSESQFKPGFFWGTIVAFVECFGGLAVVFGLYADVFVALYAFIAMTGTFWKLKTETEFADYSYDLLVMGVGALLITFGPGLWAISPPSGYPFMQVDVLVSAIVASAFIAFLPEIFGRKYVHWDA